MKYPEKISMPSGIQLWLEEQLENRGIDATVYTTYILGVLCNESSDSPIKPKDTAVKNLIEELRVKLKTHQEKGLYPFSDQSPSKKLEDPPSSHFQQEKASRSSSALPPLKSKKDSSSSSFSSPSVWSGKRSFGSSVGKNRTISEGNNRDCKFNTNWLEEDKENNGYHKDVHDKTRSRSTVKQQTPEKASRNMAKSLDRKEDFNRKMDVSKSRRLYQQTNELSKEQKEIQALWATEKSFDDLTGCDQDLPMDFQQLLESPEASKMSLDFSRCIGSKQPTSFIQCGTNITSSIWTEKADDTMECSMTGEISSDMSLNFNTSAWGMNTSEAALNRSEMLQDSNNCFKPSLWGRETGIFSGESWKAVGNIGSKESLVDFGKWSDVEGTRLMLNDTDNYFTSLGSNIHGSLTALNHNKKDSSFIEVIPKGTNSGFCFNKEIGNNESAMNRNETPKKEDEDLLISMKTHFRPIKQDIVEIVSSNTAPTFPDGTTFPISNSLDQPNFLRSPGGSLYLDSDVNKKYMEFNDAEDDSPSEFVPKFRVCQQNEKFCQTEELVIPPNTNADAEIEEMYFPEDEKLVRSMVEEDEDEEDEEDNSFWGGEACIKVDGWMATWPATGIWSNEPNVQQIWCGGSVWNTGEGEELKETSERDEYNSTRLRSEWTQEAEQLFSDISQHLCLANYVDTQPPKASLVESAWGQLSAPFQRTLPLAPPYSLMRS